MTLQSTKLGLKDGAPCEASEKGHTVPMYQESDRSEFYSTIFGTNIRIDEEDAILERAEKATNLNDAINILHGLSELSPGLGYDLWSYKATDQTLETLKIAIERMKENTNVLSLKFDYYCMTCKCSLLGLGSWKYRKDDEKHTYTCKGRNNGMYFKGQITEKDKQDCSFEFYQTDSKTLCGN